MASSIWTLFEAEKLALEGEKQQNTRADVFVTIEQVLDTCLHPKFDKNVYTIKCQSVFDHVYDSYLGDGRSVYDMTSR